MVTLRRQAVDDYWKINLNRETMRYVPRILVVKEIFSQPERYVGVQARDFYLPVDVEKVEVHVRGKKMHLAEIAERYDTYFLELKLLNPDIRKDFLPSGTHEIRIPKRTSIDCAPPCERSMEPSPP